MLIFFSGWGVDSAMLKEAAAKAGFALNPENILLTGYSPRLAADADAFFKEAAASVPDGEKIKLAGWSFGCLAAYTALHHDAFAGRVESISLVSGTLQMIDKRLGIPPAAVELTKCRLSRENFEAFTEKTFAEKLPSPLLQIDVAAKQNELACFMAAAAANFVPPAELDFLGVPASVFCGSSDAVLPISSARRFWGDLLTETNEPHGGATLFKLLS